MNFGKTLLAAALLGSVSFPAASFAKTPDAAPKEPPAATRPAPFTSTMPTAQRKILRDAMEQARTENKPLFEKLRALHDQVSKVVAASSFDQGAFLALHDQIRSVRGEMDQNRVKTLASALAKLSPEERAKMGAFMAEHEPRMGMHHPYKRGMMMHRGMMRNAPPAADAPAPEAE